MATTRKFHPDKQRQMRAEKQNRGTGNHENYLPYIQLRRNDFASRGRSHFFLSPFWPRHHELLSDLELHVLLHVQLMRPHDIREQFPLLIDGLESDFSNFNPESQGTVEIAKNLGLKHPSFGKNDHRTMTTDLLVTLRTGAFVAVHIKYVKELSEPRNIELRAIEKKYWEQRGVRFIVITEEHINRVAVGNLLMAASFNSALVGDVKQNEFHNLVLMDAERPMNSKLKELERKTGERYEVLVNRIKYSVLSGILRLNLSERVLQWDSVWPEMTISPTGMHESTHIEILNAS